MTKQEAIQTAFDEIISTKELIKVDVETNEDEYGYYVRVHHEGKVSSKIRYNHTPQEDMSLEVI